MIYTKLNRTIFIVFLFTLIWLISSFHGVSQISEDSVHYNQDDSLQKAIELKGIVLDQRKNAALPYANIYVLHKERGAISNEKGYFSINASGLDISDTVRFQYIGYKTKNMTVGQVDSISSIYLEEDIINLSETYIFGNALDANDIVKKVLKNKDSNYGRTPSKNQTFIRERSTGDFSAKTRLTATNLNQETAGFLKGYDGYCCQKSIRLPELYVQLH